MTQLCLCVSLTVCSSFSPSPSFASPHPVKPLTPPGEEKKSESRSVLEKLKSTIHPGRSQSDTEKKVFFQGVLPFPDTLLLVRFHVLFLGF